MQALVALAGSILLAAQPAWANADPVTPYSRAQEPPEMGLLDGRIRPCPLDINPNCISTSSRYGASAAIPWTIPDKDSSTAIQKIKDAILSTEKNPTIVEIKHLENGGDYLLAEMDGFLGRDAIEFLVKNNTVTYRSIAKKVVYIYPLTTPLTDFGKQQSRIVSLENRLGWTSPSFQGFGDYPEE
ncbi:hypothetical protein SELMODRAFT_405808 [Selaginella moellendorffii]|uniref:Thylakoid lumenal 17.9 kDa protein, chloroplastic n=2 Tax=Selaginella moellendorffii TaxID=88036 RepID=D8QZS1_SELML|nr:hypothetical protein SELMODRAFT_430257 [Selaginella moellendorffii]EFJ34457.1 hypothetical protein SELMODRAFT_405808 [Selaginella moellendorffii]